MHAIATVTSKGQVTLPKGIREFLQTRTVQFEVRGQEVVVRPVKSVGGSLARYARKARPLAEIRAKVWEEVARDKAENRPS